MKKIINSVLIGISALMIALSAYNIYRFFSFNNDVGKKNKEREKVEVVPFGGVRCSDKPLVSYDLKPCSDIVFDYGNSAFMAHAVPTDFKIPEYLRPRMGNEELIGIHDVVGCLVAESEKRGLNPLEAKVFVSAGYPEALGVISNDLHKAGITNIAKADSRNSDMNKALGAEDYAVRYDPKTDKFEVEKMSSGKIPDVRRPNYIRDY